MHFDVHFLFLKSGQLKKIEIALLVIFLSSAVAEPITFAPVCVCLCLLATDF